MTDCITVYGSNFTSTSSITSYVTTTTATTTMICPSVCGDWLEIQRAGARTPFHRAKVTFADTLVVEHCTQPLEHYCKQPDGLKQNENDLNACMRVFVDLRRDLKDLTLKKIGADCWVWPVIEKFTKDLSSDVPR
ncbi:hypothetical protein KCU78_g10174, partial [Aureobasidium melanogenum]